MLEYVKKAVIPIGISLIVAGWGLLVYQAYFSEDVATLQAANIDRCAKHRGIAHFDKNNRYSGCTVDYRRNPTNAE